MRLKQLILTVAAVFLAVTPALAADWQITYYGSAKGTYFLDKDSLIETGNGFKQFWILYAPRVRIGIPTEGYAYAKHLTGVNCQSRLATRYEAIYTDENGIDHPTKVKLEKNPYSIVPDSEDDFWWNYLCKPHTEKEFEVLAAPITGQNMKAWLVDQVQYSRENTALMNRNK